MMPQDRPEYDVGYGKPPEATRFKKGQSGNPRGRPKTSRNVGKMLEGIFYRKITITENGVRREVTMLEAIFRQVANGAAKGELRHVDRVMKLMPIMTEALLVERLSGEEGGPVDPQADKAVLEALTDMFGGNPEALFASVQEDIEE